MTLIRFVSATIEERTWTFAKAGGRDTHSTRILTTRSRFEKSSPGKSPNIRTYSASGTDTESGSSQSRSGNGHSWRKSIRAYHFRSRQAFLDSIQCLAFRIPDLSIQFPLTVHLIACCPSCGNVLAHVHPIVDSTAKSILFRITHRDEPGTQADLDLRLPVP